MKESESQRVCNYPTYRRDSKNYSNRGFVNIDNGTMGGPHWTCFIVKNIKSFYFDPFGAQPDQLLLNQLPKPITYRN